MSQANHKVPQHLGHECRNRGLRCCLHADPVWVMNAVPVETTRPEETQADGSKIIAEGAVSAKAAGLLGVIYERGLLGTYQDWCVMCYLNGQTFFKGSVQ